MRVDVVGSGGAGRDQITEGECTGAHAEGGERAAAGKLVLESVHRVVSLLGSIHMK